MIGAKVYGRPRKYGPLGREGGGVAGEHVHWTPAGADTDDPERIAIIEEGGTEPTVGLLRTLAAALDADVRLTAGHDLGSLWFEAHAA